MADTRVTRMSYSHSAAWVSVGLGVRSWLVRLLALRAPDVVLLVIGGVGAPDDRPITHTQTFGVTRVGKDHHLVVLGEHNPVATREAHGQRATNGFSAHSADRLIFLGAHRPSSVTFLPISTSSSRFSVSGKALPNIPQSIGLKRDFARHLGPMASFEVRFSAGSSRVDQVGQQPQCVGGVPTVWHLGQGLGQTPNNGGHLPPLLRIEARQLVEQRRGGDARPVSAMIPPWASVGSDNLTHASRPRRCHVIASAMAICPSKPSVLAMSR
jgi:hypothetical protein